PARLREGPEAELLLTGEAEHRADATAALGHGGGCRDCNAQPGADGSGDRRLCGRPYAGCARCSQGRSGDYGDEQRLLPLSPPDLEREVRNAAGTLADERASWALRRSRGLRT